MKKSLLFCSFLSVLGAALLASAGMAADLDLLDQSLSGYYQADGSITAENCQVQTGGYAWFIAQGGISLKPGFQATSGSSFGAIIGGYQDLPDDLDNDTDDLADWWELFYFGGLGQGRDDDFDVDGVTNYTEYASGTSPTDGADYYYKDTDYGLDPDEQQGGGGLVGQTVRILNGNVTEVRDDLDFASPHSLGLSFKAVYNSRSDISGALGFGWTHTYGASLDPAVETGAATLIKIVDQTGGAHFFQEETAGVFAGTLKELSQVKTEAGDYVWYRLDGSRYGFSAPGRLLWIDDEKGNRLTLAYDGQDRLETVTDTVSGRTLTFYYNGEGLLDHITGPVSDAVADGIWVSYGYDASQNLTQVTYADGSGYQYGYEDPLDAHNLTEKRNALDHLLNSWSYDAQDRCESSFSREGKTVSIDYVSASQVEITDGYGTLRTYTIGTIDGLKRLTAMQGAPGAAYSDSNAVRWQYDSEMRLAEIEYAGGSINRYQDYDSRGNPRTQILAAGSPQERVISATYHPAMNVKLSQSEASVLSGGSKVTVWDYDNDYDSTPNEAPGGLPCRIVEQGYTRNAAGAVEAYEYITTVTYNGSGQVLTIDGPRTDVSDQTTATYFANGDLASITRPVVGGTSFSDYDAAGQVGQVTDENSQSENIAYDGRGRVISITHAADQSELSVTYNLAGLPESITDEDGIPKSFDYDPDYGRLIRINDVEGNYIAYSYDDQGNRIDMSKHESSGLRTAWKRWAFEERPDILPGQQPDIAGKLWLEIKADGAFAEYNYDSAGNISSVTDFKGNVTGYGYDAMNRLAAVIQPGALATDYAYDSHGNLESVTDAESQETTYEYDDMGRLVTTVSPDTGTVAYVYDEAGNAVRQTDAKDIVVQRSYDALNRLTAVHFPDPAQDIAYTYDERSEGIGRLTGMVDASGSVSFDYDSRGRLTAKSATIEGILYPLTRNYTPGGRVDVLSYPSGRTVNYSHNSAGNIESVATTKSYITTTLVSNIAYLPFGAPKAMDLGSGAAVDNQSGECECLESANPSQQMEQSYSYDGNGNLESVQAANAYLARYNRTYAYDALNRLESATGPYGTIGYTYDGVGNRLTRTINGQSANYSYLTGTNRLDAISGSEYLDFSYDANGNITGLGNKTLIYNQDNRLVRVEMGGVPLGEYAYNGLGQRVKKDGGGVTTIYHYGFDGNIVAESLPDGTAVSDYVYMGEARVAKAKSSGIYYYHNDRIGTPLLMTNASNTVVWEALYKPFGDAEVNDNSTAVNNFRFAGQYYDAETGLHYNYHRYYDPKTGRYLRPDPIGLAGGINLYAYVQNNPVNLIYPDGVDLAQKLIKLSKKFYGKVMRPAAGKDPRVKIYDKEGKR